MARTMTRYQAHQKAHALWHRFSGPGGAREVGDRTAMTVTRRKTVPHRFEVGYMEIVTKEPRETWRTVVLGRGDSWEDAFLRAQRTDSPV